MSIDRAEMEFPLKL